MFADFECPFCGRFARDVLPVLEREYVATGQVQIAYRHLPLPNHSHAVGAAVAVECAGQQGAFWPMHDKLFEEGADLGRNGVLMVAESLRLDLAAFDGCLQEEAPRAVVIQDAEEARAYGVTATPSFFVGSRLPDGRVSVMRAFSGALPVETFRHDLERALRGEIGESASEKIRSLLGIGAS